MKNKDGLNHFSNNEVMYFLFWLSCFFFFNLENKSLLKSFLSSFGRMTRSGFILKDYTFVTCMLTSIASCIQNGNN